MVDWKWAGIGALIVIILGIIIGLLAGDIGSYMES